MYKKESIRKLHELLMTALAYWMTIAVELIPMCISSGNRKIGRVLNVSLPPVISCGNCKQCMHFCYDIKACLRYTNTVISARIRNWVILQKDRDEYFRRIDEKLARRRSRKFFRWHVAGDIIDADYLDRMVQLARKYPDFRFCTYTKMYSLVNRYHDENGGRDAIPENLVIMFSDWDGVPMPNPYNHPVFACRMKDGNKDHDPEYFEHLFKCPGNCDYCTEHCRGCVAGESAFTDQH